MMDCHEFRRLTDSYLNDELLVETNHDVLRHLENCRDCRAQLEGQRELRFRLRNAVVSAANLQIDTSFASRLQSDLRQTALRPGIWEQLTAGGFGGLRSAALSLACLLVIAIGGFFILGPLNERSAANNDVNQRGQNDTIVEANRARLADAVKVAWNELSSQAVGDHKNCAVKFNLDDRPIPLDEAVRQYGPLNKDIDKAVFEAAKTAFDDDRSAPIKLVEAHVCIFGGRRFTHIVLSRHGKVISVLVTDTDLPAESDSTVTDRIYGASNAAGFSIGTHAIFVVSDMEPAENIQVARAILPVMRRHLETAGA
ncbi:MAG: zf-HC2 domain-containing protein [Acidobacteriota bacterium]